MCAQRSGFRLLPPRYGVRPPFGRNKNKYGGMGAFTGG